MNNENMNERDDLGSIGIGAMIVFIALILVAAVASAVIIQTGEKLQQNAQQTGSDTQEEIGGKISIITIWVGTQSDCDGDDSTTATGTGAADGVGADILDKCITLVYELAAGSEQMNEDQIHWSISCLDNAGTGLDMVWGTFDAFPTNANAYSAGVLAHASARNGMPNVMNSDTVNVDGTHRYVDDDGGGTLTANDDDDDTLSPGQVYMINLKTEPDTLVTAAPAAITAMNPYMTDAPGQNQGECSPVLNEQHLMTISVVGGGTTTEILSYTSVTQGASVV